MSAVGGHGVMAGGFGHIQVRAVEDDARLVVAGAGQGVEQRSAGRFIQTDGLRGDLRRFGEVCGRNRGDDLFDRVAADAVAQQQFVLGEHFQFEGFIGRAGFDELLQLTQRNSTRCRICDFRRRFQPERQKRIEIGAGESHPALPVAFDVDHTEDGQGGWRGITLVSPPMAVLSSATGSLMMGLVFMDSE